MMILLTKDFWSNIPYQDKKTKDILLKGILFTLILRRANNEKTIPSGKSVVCIVWAKFEDEK